MNSCGVRSAPLWMRKRDIRASSDKWHHFHACYKVSFQWTPSHPEPDYVFEAGTLLIRSNSRRQDELGDVFVIPVCLINSHTSFGNLKDTDATWWRVPFGKLLERIFVMPIAGQKPPLFFQGHLELFALFQVVCVFLPRFLAQPWVPQNPNWEIQR
jgi:hypothetical protein